MNLPVVRRAVIHFEMNYLDNQKLYLICFFYFSLKY
jgi:hypothetical protein